MPSKTFAGISQAPRIIDPDQQPVEPVEALPPEGDGDGEGEGGASEEAPQGGQPPAVDQIDPPAGAATPKATGKRQQARTAAGTFQADDPATPDKNEAFVEG